MGESAAAATHRQGATHAAEPAPAPVRGYVLALAGVAGLAVAGGLLAAALLWPRTPGGALLGLLFAILVGFAFALERRALVLRWRNLRTISSFDEPVVFLALALLPPLALVPLIACSMTLVQVAARRARIKSAFNVGAYTTAAALAALATGALATRAGFTGLAAATVGLAVYTLASNTLVAALFARLESRGVWDVFRERFALATIWHVVLGVALGIGIVALWMFNPFATLIMVPLTLMAVSFMRLSARTEREVAAHRTLAQMAAQLAGTRDTDEVAERVLDACEQLFLWGRARLELQRGEAPPRAWTREAEGGPAPGKPPMEAAIVGKDGRALGRIVLEPPRRVRDASREVDPPLLAIVAGQAAGAVENAWALDEIAEMKDFQQGIVENVPAGVVRLDGEGRILQVNSRFHAELGEGKPIPEASPLARLPLLAGEPSLREAIEGLRRGRAFGNREARIEGRAYIVSGVPLGGFRGGRGAVVLFHDVTARREGEQALHEQGVTRPVVRRLILNLVGGFNASRFAIAEMGRSLAGEIEGDTIEAYTTAFRAMGLGRLTFEERESGGYRFRADDLLERQAGSLQPTCHLALGFVEGVVGKLHGGKALGSEVNCQSQGHARCVFIVKPKA
jgi:predicted hydrocarbon binding protein/PAS domain-containing protein